MVRRVMVDGMPLEVELLPEGRVRVGDRIEEVSVVATGSGRFSMLCGAKSFVVRAQATQVFVAAQRLQVSVEDPRAFSRAERQGLTDGKQALTAPMPGRVVRILKSVGAAVEPGEGIVVVEAMKMQNELKAAQAGVVSSIAVSEGEAVAAGQVLATIEQNG